MAYMYCKECGNELDNPTTKEMIRGYITCNKCSVNAELVEDLKEDALLDILDRLIKVEVEVKLVKLILSNKINKS